MIFTVVALWSLQVMSSAWIRVFGDRDQEGGRRSRAEKLYKVSASIDPQNWKAFLGLGQLYYETRYHELDSDLKHEWAAKEQKAYAAAYRQNVKKEEVVYGLGRVELFLGNRDKGLDYLRQAASYKRFNDFYWRKLGIELRKAGLYAEASAAFEHARKLDPANSVVKRNLQWLKKQMSEGRGQTSENKR